jgi:putative CocE/NonD family hydrolase
MMKRVFIAALLAAAPLAAQQTDDTLYVRKNFVKREARIAMRDGVHLFTTIYVPRDTTQRYPILLRRTPYSAGPYGDTNYVQLGGFLLAMAEQGYIIAFQDVRGRFMSEGDFVDVRPQVTTAQGAAPRATNGGAPLIDESTDTWDTIDWLVKNVPANNGRVAMQGVSYPGFYSATGGINHHPALRVISPQAPVADWFIGDDFHHNGALYLAHTFHFFSGFGQPRPAPTPEGRRGMNIGTPDGYRFFLDLGPLPNVKARWYGDSIRFWNDVVAHPTYDAFWKARNILPHLRNMPPAVMTVGGWYDAEDLYGPLKVYQSIEEKNPGITNVLVMGPWFHGQWSGGPGDALGAVRYPPTGPYFRDSIAIPFFNHFMKDGPDPRLPEAIVFEAGANRWRRFDAWPPREVQRRSLHLRESGRLSFDAPSAVRAAADEFVSDPAHPVPYVGYVTPGMSIEHMVDDQRFAATRPDVLVYQTPPLTEDVTIAGPITATLWVSTTGTDADWVVKVIDVYPDTLPTLDPELWAPQRIRLGGYQQLVRGELFRGRFRNSFERPEAFVPGRVTKVEYELPDVLHTFQRGHRIMIQVQSSWFPLVDRNPQTFVDIYQAKESDFKKATHRVHRTRAQASRVTVGVLAPAP